MGLDMYAYSVRPECYSEETDFTVPEGFSNIKEWYWRKFSELHSWMERLYRAKGGKEESFNCVSVNITRKDLEQLKVDIENNCLTHVEGFFFGGASPEEGVAEDCMKFYNEAVSEINNGYKVYYTSWW